MSKQKHEQGPKSEREKKVHEETQGSENHPLVPETEGQPNAEGIMERAPGAVDSPEAQLAAARAEIEVLKSQLAEVNDKYLRALAEQVNFRKRIVREKEEFQQYAVSSLIKEALIPVLDDFDRSLDAVAQNSNDPAKIIEGIQLIQKRLYDTLANKYGLVKLESNGHVFDPQLHEALFSDQGQVVEPMVTQEFMPGYKLHDRIIRAAKVKVTMPLPSTSSGSKQAEISVSDAASNSATKECDSNES